VPVETAGNSQDNEGNSFCTVTWKGSIIKETEGAGGKVVKKFVTAAIIIFSIIIIISGRFYYNEKLDNTASSAKEQLNGTAAEELEENVQEEVTEETDAVEEEAEESGTEEASESEVDELTAGLQEPLAELIREKEAEGESVQLLVVGSRSSTDYYDQGMDTWPVLLQEELNEAYGDGFFQIERMTFGIHTSQEIVDQNAHAALADEEADILLLEGFNWNDNLAAVPMENARGNLMEMVAVVEEENEDVFVMIQPSAPVHGTSIYPVQVEEFGEFVLDSEYNYVNHWEAWPAVDDESLLNYLDEESQNMPNEDGHELWKDYLSPWFISQ
jgi:nucleotide-binding universal stress UspA family protein